MHACVVPSALEQHTSRLNALDNASRPWCRSNDGLCAAFKKDSDSRKLNLGVGAYRTAEGKPLVLNVVRTAEKRIASDTSRDKVPVARSVHLA